MNSSRKPTRPEPPGAVLVREGGVRTLPVPSDPIRAWLDLMEVVDALRPPVRPPSVRRSVGKYLL